ncbi:hypothetical protein F5Y13DRAFT_199328 [Hypoxylon sp. FL1857]|nr:hypothetical protein F5Y13DRAFT_199328 [Hypoxylon sp. FL1857]
MAIIPDFPGAEVTVHICGEVASEYDDPNTTGQKQKQDENAGAKVCSKYIECKDDAPFSIHLKVTNQYKWAHRNQFLAIEVYIDGKWVNWVFCTQQEVGLGDWEHDVSYRAKRKSGQQAYSHSINAMQLSANENGHSGAVEEADANEIKHDLRKLEHMGIIEVKFDVTKDDESDDDDDDDDDSLEITEKALKGKTISHGTRFSNPAEATKAPRKIASPKVDGIDLPKVGGPIAIFRFMYRSQESLIQEGIIARPSTMRDTKSVTPTTLVGLTQGEIEALALERLQEKQTYRVSEAENRTSSSLKRKHEKAEDVEDIKDIEGMEEVNKESKTLIKHGTSQIINLAVLPRPYKMAKMADGRDIIDLDDNDH